MNDTKAIMEENPLNKIMAPASISVAGVSGDPGKMGSIIFLNLVHGGFAKDVLPVHPKNTELFGHKAYASPEELPYSPELAVLVVPTVKVLEVLEGFGKIGTRHAIVITAGFREIGGGGVSMEKRLQLIAEKYRMRILGPNCLGVINASNGLNTTAVPIQDKPGSFSPGLPRSGSYVAQTLSYLKDRGIRFSKAISVGNETDIDLVDCLHYLGQDPETKAIGLYIESIRDGNRFLKAAREISKKKPILAQYVGGTGAGAKAGASHTGAMAGPDYLYDALFSQAGIIRLETMAEVFAVGHSMAQCPHLSGNRIGVLTNSGGPGTGMATTLEMNGLKTPAFSDQLKHRLEKYLPAHGSARNPVDLTFHTGMELLADKLPEILLQSDEIDGLLIHGIMDTGFMKMLYPIFQSVQDIPLSEFKKKFLANVKNLIEMPRRFKKPIILSSFLGQEDHALCQLREHGMPTFDVPEMAAKAMARLLEYHGISNRQEDKIDSGNMAIPERAEKLVSAGKTSGMDEFTAKEVLRACGIPTCREYLAGGIADAVAAARQIGFPVVIKGCAPEIAHKTERNMVRVNVADDDQVKRACDAIGAQMASPRFLVCEMLPANREFMAGVIRHPGFPPAVLFGLGGIFTETISDFSLRLAPFGNIEALRLIDAIKAKQLLGPIRGLPPVDKNALASLLIRLGEIALHFTQIREIDLNPILIDDGMPKVVDALFIMGDHPAGHRFL